MLKAKLFKSVHAVTLLRHMNNQIIHMLVSLSLMVNIPYNYMLVKFPTYGKKTA